MICGSSGIANWPSRHGRLDPALGAAVHNRNSGFGSDLSGVVRETRTWWWCITAGNSQPRRWRAPSAITSPRRLPGRSLSHRQGRTIFSPLRVDVAGSLPLHALIPRPRPSGQCSASALVDQRLTVDHDLPGDWGTMCWHAPFLARPPSRMPWRTAARRSRSRCRSHRSYSDCAGLASALGV